MIVEFIGCTGSGKTALINRIQSSLSRTTKVITASELVASRIGLGAIKNSTLQNLVQEVVCLPYFVRSLRTYRAFLALTFRESTRNTHLSLATISNLRSLERKIGGYEITRRHDRDAIILVDEGPIQAVHMFAFSISSVSPREITRFAHLLPLPDLVIYVKSPLDMLIKRTLERSDRPREMNPKNETLMENYVRNAVTLFEQLTQTEELRDCVLVVDNPDRTLQDYDKQVNEISESILNWKTRRTRTGCPSSPSLIPGGEIC